MLKPSVYLRLFGLAAGGCLVAAAVAQVGLGGPPAKSTAKPAAKPAANAALQPPPSAPDSDPALAQAPAVLAEASAGNAAAEQTGAIAPAAGAPRATERAAPERPPPQGASELSPSARAALVPRPAAVDPPAAKGGRLDLNRASVEELNALRGAGRIGRRIVKSRPYRSAEDLVRKRVISRTAFARIKDQVRVGRE